MEIANSRRTFLKTFNLLVGEGGAIALELPLETQPHLRVLVARRIVQVRVAVGDVAVVAICRGGRNSIANRSISLSLFTSITQSRGRMTEA